MLFGCNLNHYADVAPDVPGMGIVRTYIHYDSFPVPWPATPAGTVGLFSMKPDYAKLMSGSLDAVLTACLKAAPAGAWLATWHERNSSHMNTLGYTAAQFREIDTKMLSLCRAANPGIKYGVILNDASSGLMNWTIDGLDFYGVDIYEGKAGTGTVRDISSVLKRDFDQLPATGLRVVGETNSSTPAHRPSWFRECYDWLKTNNGGAMCSFWLPTGAYSGPWLPSDAATVYSMRQVANDAQRGTL